MLRNLLTIMVLILAGNMAATEAFGGWGHHHGFFHHGYAPAYHAGYAVTPAAVPSYYHTPVAVQSVGVQSVGVLPMATYSPAYTHIVHSHAPFHVHGSAAGTQNVQSVGPSSIADIIAIIKMLREEVAPPTPTPTPTSPAPTTPNPELTDVQTRLAALEGKIKTIQSSLADMQNQLNSSAHPGASESGKAVAQLQADVAKIKSKLKID